MHIAIVDDQAMFAQGLHSWLIVHAPDVTVEYAGPDPLAAVALGKHLDVVLLKVNPAPEVPSAAETVERFARAQVPVLLVSGMARGAQLRKAVLAGAAGYVARSAEPAELLARLRQVAHGDLVITREMAEAMISPAPPDLSGQELRALRLYAQGMPLKTVARTMAVSQHTAKEYLDRVRAKYASHGRVARTKAQLHAAAQEDGLLE